MGKITGFKEYSRSNYEKISPEVRIKNWDTSVPLYELWHSLLFGRHHAAERCFRLPAAQSHPRVE